MLGIVMTVVTIYAANQRITLSVFSALLLLAAAGMAWHGFRRTASCPTKPPSDG